MKKKKINIKKRIIRITTLILIILGLSYFVINYFNQKEPIKKDPVETEVVEEETIKTYKASLIMAGDVLIHDSVYKDAKIDNDNYDFTKMFTQIKPIVEKYDLAYINQETMIGGKALGLSTYPQFNSPEEVGDAVVDTGFNLISLANNHTLDRGEKAIINSDKYWKEKNVITAGAYTSFEDRNNIKVYEKNGIKYAFLSYTIWDNGLKAPTGKEYLINLFDKEQAKQDVEKVKDQVDIILVAMHWGIEYSHSENLFQRETAEYLSNLGVNIIVGTHPHVIQPIEYINDTLVIYSLGNFISAQIGEERLVGAMASIDIIKTVENNHVNISFSNLSADLIYTKYTNFRNFQVIPFANLNNTILPNYSNVFEKYKKIITKYNQEIVVR